MSSLVRWALAILCLCSLPCRAAPHFDCQPGPVQFETVRLQDRNVIFLRQGPHCPQALAAPSAPSASAAPSAAAGSAALGSGALGSAAVATDADEPTATMLPASAALHRDAPTAATAGAGPLAGSGLPAWVPLAGALLAVLAIAGPAAYWDQRVRRPRLLAQKEELEEVALAAELEAGALREEVASASAALAAQQAEELSRVDAIVVLGGGLSKDGNLPPWVQERLNRAAELHEKVGKAKRDLSSASSSSDAPGDAQERRTHVVTMCEGIRNSARDPRLRSDPSQKLESQIAADYLKTRGVSEADIITDELSLDTVGNAYFLRTTQADVSKARSLLVVTNDFHTQRARAIVTKLYSLGPFPDGNNDYQIAFEPVPNFDIEPSSLKKRQSFERKELEEFERVSKDWKDLHDVHAYLFSGEETNELPAEQREMQLPLSFHEMKYGQEQNEEHYDDMTHAYQLAVEQQEREKSQQQEDTDERRQGQKPAEPPQEQQKGCGPFNCGPCSSSKNVTEPEGR